MFVFKYENDSYGIPYLIATRFSPAGVNPFPVMAGLLTRPSRRAFPALHQWQVAATLRGLTDLEFTKATNNYVKKIIRKRLEHNIFQPLLYIIIVFT